MDAAGNQALAAELVPLAYIRQGSQSLRAREARVRDLLSQRRLPTQGWSDADLEALMGDLAAMDSNNFPGSVGVGEREGRIFSSLVRRRHFGMGHGIGRSGDVAAVQPKAAGSSLLYALTNALLADVMRLIGLRRAMHCIALPLATGMTLSLVLLTLREARPTAKYVIWPRIDQKSCLKSILTAGLEPIVIENVYEGQCGLGVEARRTEASETAKGAARRSRKPRGEAVAAAAGGAGGGAGGGAEAGVEAVVEAEAGAETEAGVEAGADGAFRAPPLVADAGSGAGASDLVGHRRALDATSEALVSSASSSLPPEGPGCLRELYERGGDELRTDTAAIAAAIARVGADNVLCVMTTTSCFAPRGYDRVEDVATLCARAGVPHVVNNAYGLQSSQICHALNEACRVGRVDAIVQSTDKNLLVPVGGAIVSSPHKRMVEAVSRVYPGRASSGPIVDVFLTLLSMGSEGLLRLLRARKENFPYLRAKLQEVAARVGERVLYTPHNSISIALTLATLQHDDDDEDDAVDDRPLGGCEDAHGKEASKASEASEAARGSDPEVNSEPAAKAKAKAKAKPSADATFFGSMLFSRGVSGARVVPTDDSKTIGGITFHGYGSQAVGFPCPYMTVACSLGLAREEIDVFAEKLERTFREFRKRATKQRARAPTLPVTVVDEAAGGGGGRLDEDRRGTDARGEGEEDEEEEEE